MAAKALCGRSADLDDVEVEIAAALGRAEERARIKAIVTSRAAIGRVVPALTLAFESELPPQEVIDLLQRMPVENPKGSGLTRLFNAWGRR